MKKGILLVMVLTAFLACKNDSKSKDNSESSEVQEEKTEKQNDGLVLMKGEFVYFADAAVLQTSSNSIYGVVIDAKMHELNDLAQQYKKEPTDYVHVEVRAKIIPKPANEEGWPYRVEIKEILKVDRSQIEDEVIKLGTE
ncbi:NlpE-like protein [Flavobacteriaceae bacterium MAR_2010_105]|nr:NlpE-like protein [Flavobacteriaceae bacterium MAR_2010_105]